MTISEEQFEELSTTTINSIKRGYVTNEQISNKTPYAISQISYLGKVTPSEMIFPYGMQAIPPEGTISILFNIFGHIDNIAGIPYCQNERFKILQKAGEVIVGSPKFQNYVHFKADGSIDIESKNKISIKAAGSIDIESKDQITINVTGNVELKAQNVNIDAAQTNLGTGGKKIALNGDPVVEGKVVASGTNTSI